MAEKYRVTVNGTSYDVEVETLGAVSAPALSPALAPAAPSTPAPARSAAPAPTPAPAPAPAPAAPVSASGGESVLAPMPGKILRVIVSEGMAVATGDVLMILEAMKMENEIVAPMAGTVTQLAAKEGATVNSGDVLAVIG